MATPFALFLTVDFSAMTDPDDKDDQFAPINPTQDSVIANPIAPEFTVFSSEGFSDPPGIRIPSYFPIEESDYAATRLRT